MPTPDESPQSRKLDDLQAALELNRRLADYAKAVKDGKLHTLEPLLPTLLTLKGQPYTLEDHFPFAPLFRTRMPSNVVVMSGRQVAKSTTVAANGVVVANSIPFFNTLYIAPLYEQIRRLSNNYVKPFIDTSPVRHLWTGTSTENSVLQRSFRNGSQLFFSFALLDAERIRGISADRINYDECQDLDKDHVPIIREVMSHSAYGIQWFTGTPKTEDVLIEKLWLDSSQAEWFIRCGCGKWNIPCLEHHILKMIGKYREDIGPERPAVVCHDCSKPLDPRSGRWVHRKPEKRWEFAGYHIPQIIMPIHYNSKKKWAELLAKQRGAGNTSPAKFKNEVLGESAGEGIKLVTEKELKDASCLGWKNNPEDPTFAVERSREYSFRCLAVDWGGGGDDEISFTTMAVLGFRAHDGGVDVIWGKRMLDPSQHVEEAKECLHIFNLFNCDIFAHDYTGAGSLRETFMVQAGIPLSRIVPIALYRTAAKDIMTPHIASVTHPRDYWILDKARSLLLVCNAIKFKYVKFFEYDRLSNDEPGLTGDFLALMEHNVDTLRAGKIYTVMRNPQLSDDFAQAVNIGCCATWYTMQAWPNMAVLAGMEISAAQMAAASPPPEAMWQDTGDAGMGGFLGMP